MNIKIEEAAPQIFKPETAIILHSDGKRSIAMEHAIRRDRKGALKLAPGRFVTPSFVERCLETKHRTAFTIVPPHVVATANNAIAWFVPAGKRILFFDPDRDDKSTMPFDGMVVPHPPMLFAARGYSLNVYALAENVRPAADTLLMHAPYWNVYENGALCVGTMPLPETIRPEKTDEITEAFFRSNFTHLCNKHAWAFPGTYAQLLAAVVERGSWDREWLAPSGRTLEAALCSA